MRRSNKKNEPGTNSGRRHFLRGAIGSGIAAAVAGPQLWAASVVQPAQPAQEGPSAAAIRAFYASLTEAQRKTMCFAWDHIGFTKLPLRLHVTNNWNISPASLSSFSKEQQPLIEAILASVLAEGWPERLKRQARDDTNEPWGNQKIAIFGTPGKGPCQCVITGFHLTLRASCERSPSVAFGGALSHGHQPSGFNERVGHPNNFYWYQAQFANQVFKALGREARRQALVTRDMPFYMYEARIDRRHILPDTKLPVPLEPDVRFKGPRGPFPGLRIGEMTREQKLLANQALDSMLQPYRRPYQDQVRSCLQRQGGLDACHFAFYQEHDLGNDGEWDNWRIEGPSLVWYYRGFPHVHIWIHVADDPATRVTSHFG